MIKLLIIITEGDFFVTVGTKQKTDKNNNAERAKPPCGKYG